MKHQPFWSWAVGWPRTDALLIAGTVLIWVHGKMEYLEWRTRPIIVPTSRTKTCMLTLGTTFGSGDKEIVLTNLPMLITRLRTINCFLTNHRPHHHYYTCHLDINTIAGSFLLNTTILIRTRFIAAFTKTRGPKIHSRVHCALVPRIVNHRPEVLKKRKAQYLTC